jgi:hypothetical protein
MLIEQVWNFHDGTTAWAITGDEWSPMFIDLEITTGRFARTGEVWLWIQASVGTQALLYGDNDEYYRFILKSSATNDDTNLDGTIKEHIATPLYSKTGAGTGDTRLVAGRRPFFATAIPPEDLLRYIQLYCDTTGTCGNSDLQVYAGLAPSKSAIPNIAYLQTARPSYTNVVAPT